MVEGVYCPDCAGDNCFLSPRFGEGAYRCKDCGSVFYNPIILDCIAPAKTEA